MIRLQKLCFIGAKRYMSEWLLSGRVSGSELHPENINFAVCFHRFFTARFTLRIVWHIKVFRVAYAKMPVKLRLSLFGHNLVVKNFQ